VTREIVSGLPAETATALEAMRYGPYVVGASLEVVEPLGHCDHVPLVHGDAATHLEPGMSCGAPGGTG